MKFRVGDRVAVYGGLHNIGANSPLLTGERGTVAEPPDSSFPECVWVRFDKEIEKGEKPAYYVHPKQCRRLKPKAPRRRLYVYKQNDDLLTPEGNIHPNYTIEGIEHRLDEYVEFIEVRRKK